MQCPIPWPFFPSFQGIYWAPMIAVLSQLLLSQRITPQILPMFQNTSQRCTPWDGLFAWKCAHLPSDSGCDCALSQALVRGTPALVGAPSGIPAPCRRSQPWRLQPPVENSPFGPRSTGFHRAKTFQLRYIFRPTLHGFHRTL